jgi:hypothetical protein
MLYYGHHITNNENVRNISDPVSTREAMEKRVVESSG